MTYHPETRGKLLGVCVGSLGASGGWMRSWGVWLRAAEAWWAWGKGQCRCARPSWRGCRDISAGVPLLLQPFWLLVSPGPPPAPGSEPTEVWCLWRAVAPAAFSLRDMASGPGIRAAQCPLIALGASHRPRQLGHQEPRILSIRPRRGPFQEDGVWRGARRVSQLAVLGKAWWSDAKSHVGAP